MDHKKSRANHECILSTEDKEKMIAEASVHYQSFLEALLIDTENDHNTQGTAQRYSKMMVNEVCRGRFDPPPTFTAFPNAESYTGLVCSGPLPVKSMCSHHMMPIDGHAWVCVLPNEEGKLLGLSKYGKIVDRFAGRPQIQEEMTTQILNELVKVCDPKGAAVLIEGKHMCQSHRGMRVDGVMSTTDLYGDLFNPEVRAEFESFVQRTSRKV